MTAETETDWAEKIGKPAYEGIAEMVAALECDYDRLEELRDERDGWEPEEVPEDFEVAELSDEDKEHAADVSTCGYCGRSWDDAVVTGRTPAPGARCPFEDFHGFDTWAEANPDDAEELAELEEAAGECESREDAETRIREDALDVTIRGERRNGEWEADEFTILLTTGGPAVRIKGELGRFSEPDRAWLEVQDWFKPWTQYFPADQDTLLTYCRQFCFE